MSSKFRKILFSALIVLIIISQISCKSKRHVLKSSIKEHGFSYLYKKMIENQIQFDYLSAKFNISYQENKTTTNLKGQIRIKNDSIIWLSVTPALGIEAVRVQLTNDSIKFINRLNKSYFSGEYSLIDSLINTTIDYSLLQSMLVGNDLTQYDVNKFRSSIDGNLYKMTIRERRKIKDYIKQGEIDTRVLVQQIWLYHDNFRIARINVKEQGEDDNNKLKVFYSDYLEVDGQLFPAKIRIEITSTKSITVELDYNKVELNNPLRFPFKIPRKYTDMFTKN